MALVTLYMSDLDPNKTLFTSKKEADAHDKKLELAENISAYLQHKSGNLSEELAEEIGLIIAEEKDLFLKALKGSPGALQVDTDEEQSGG